jgi:hypothetical protein
VDERKTNDLEAGKTWLAILGEVEVNGSRAAPGGL